MRIYIIGKYSQLPRDFAVAKFNLSEEQLIAAGIPASCIVNPVKIVPEGTEWRIAMDKYCLPEVRKCTAMYIQRDWTDSLGAREEVTEAMNHRKDLFFENHGGLKEIAYLADVLI